MKTENVSVNVINRHANQLFIFFPKMVAGQGKNGYFEIKNGYHPPSMYSRKLNRFISLIPLAIFLKKKENFST